MALLGILCSVKGFSFLCTVPCFFDLFFLFISREGNNSPASFFVISNLWLNYHKNVFRILFFSNCETFIGLRLFDSAALKFCQKKKYLHCRMNRKFEIPVSSGNWNAFSSPYLAVSAILREEGTFFQKNSGETGIEHLPALRFRVAQPRDLSCNLSTPLQRWKHV